MEVAATEVVVDGNLVRMRRITGMFPTLSAASLWRTVPRLGGLAPSCGWMFRDAPSSPALTRPSRFDPAGHCAGLARTSEMAGSLHQCARVQLQVGGQMNGVERRGSLRARGVGSSSGRCRRPRCETAGKPPDHGAPCGGGPRLPPPHISGAPGLISASFSLFFVV